MKFSYQWLCELVPGLKTEPQELQRLITMKTAECEGIEVAGSHFPHVLAVRVTGVEALPKGKNNLVTIDAGDGRTRQVVCGAPNVRQGMIAAWVQPGTLLDGKTIGRAVIEGAESEGMLASAAELGINRDHSGLLELSGVEVGQHIPQLSPDWIIEIDNKSLTHRPDLWGHYGMAREVAALAKLPLRDPVNDRVLPAGDPAIAVRIADFRLCPRYSAVLVENIRVADGPVSMQARLESVGLNPINNIVDVTNYVLAELPQPMHAFDADKLHGSTIFVRLARAGEKLKALNGETYELDPADLVIADEAGPIALAGVIGGADSAISETTTRVVLESANFNASSVRLTSSRHKLRTDASMRFEKALDPENTVRGLARALELLERVVPGLRATGITDVNSERILPPPISLSTAFVSRKLGTPVTQGEITEILSALGFTVAETAPDILTVSVPSWRATKDISLADDLVEEVGRMIGYGEITPVPPRVAAVPPPQNPLRLYMRDVRRQLADQGFTEVYNYSFVNEQQTARFGMDIRTHIAVRNPIASELTHLRRSLLPGLLENIVKNVRHSADFRIFEIGSEIHPRHAGELPDEQVHVAGAIYNLHADESDFFEMKRVLEFLLPRVRLSATIDPAPYEHPARSATVYWLERVVGRLFELHPSVLHDAGVEGRAIFFDLDLGLVEQLHASRTKTYQPLRRYPTSGFDLSVVAEARLPVAQIEEELVKLAGESLALIDFVRQYSGPPLSEGQKSVSYHIEIGARDHTLTAEEATDIRNRIIEGMKNLGYELRV